MVFAWSNPVHYEAGCARFANGLKLKNTSGCEHVLAGTPEASGALQKTVLSANGLKLKNASGCEHCSNALTPKASGALQKPCFLPTD